MTKTEKRRMQNKAAIKALITYFNIYNIEDEEGGRISFTVDSLDGDTFRGEFMRGRFDVDIVDAIPLGGGGWTQADRLRQQGARDMETQMNKLVQRVVAKIDDATWIRKIDDLD